VILKELVKKEERPLPHQQVDQELVEEMLETEMDNN
jgi:hypothetical protein